MILNRNALLMCVVTLVLATGCSKKVVPGMGNDPSTVVIDVVNNGQGDDSSPEMSRYYQADWTSYKCGGHAQINIGGNSLSSSMHMRMLRGRAIYVSMRPVIGIEVAKMVISGDSILLVDKVHKRYILEKASLLTNGLPVTVEALQDMFLGRAFELGEGSFNQSMKDDFDVERSSDGNVKLMPKHQFNGFEYHFLYNPQGNILSLDVTPTSSGASTYSVTYSNVKPTVAGKVATQVNVSTKINGRVFVLALEYKDLKWNEDFSIDTKVPKNYKRLEAKDIVQILSGGN